MFLRRTKHILALGLAAGIAGLTAGCSEYLARRDTVSFGAGDAKAHNAAVHTVDPWPGHAFRTDMRTPGSSAEKAMENYRNGNDAPAAGAVPAPTAGATTPSAGR